jgi:hypothetical protein
MLTSSGLEPGVSPKSQLHRKYWAERIRNAINHAQSDYLLLLNIISCYQSVDYQASMSELDKANVKFVERTVDPYAGLSAEDAGFMRQYEGPAGKKVVSKVCFFVIHTG